MRIRKLKVLLTALITFFYVGLQIGELLHELAVSHYYCALDGEISHIKHDHKLVRSSKGGFAEQQRFVKFLDEDADGTNQCHIVSSFRPSFANAYPANTIVGFFDFTNLVSNITLNCEYFYSEPLYRLVPKTSPPFLS